MVCNTIRPLINFDPSADRDLMKRSMKSGRRVDEGEESGRMEGTPIEDDDEDADDVDDADAVR